MRRWLLPLACVCLLFTYAAHAEAQPGPSENVLSNEVPFQFTSGYLIQVEGRIGDQANLKFILDTGATVSMVSQRIAESLKLGSQRAQSYSFDRSLKWETATAPEVQFGPIRAANVLVLVGDLTGYSQFAGKADAIIGLDLLGLRDVIIDLGTSHLIYDPAATRIYSQGGDPMAKCVTVELEVQDRPVHLLVDTGAPGILLYEERLREVVPGLRTVGSIRNATMGGRVPVKQAILPDVVFGKRNRQVSILLLPSPAPDTLPGIDGILGIAALQAHRVHFVFSRRTCWWE